MQNRFGKEWDEQDRERLLELAQRAEREKRMSRAEVQQLLHLYRRATNALAEAKTRHPESLARRRLEVVVGRAYGAIYREPERRVGAVALFRERLPRLFRGRWGYFLFALGCFLFGCVLGMVAVAIDERWAELFLPVAAIEAVRGGELWTDVFGILPGSVISALIFFNNAMVCVTAFALGLVFGVGTIYVLFMNGLMLGGAAMLCWRYGLLEQLLGFVVGHGVLEISAILLAGAAGLLMGDALVRPGPYRRLDALRLRAQEAVVLAIGALPFLLVAGLIEGFISPGDFSDPLKYVLGLSAGLTMYLYLLTSGRSEEGKGPVS
jgi:uncharacterized membrane protein SpoIIM required for sporulation